MFTKRLLHTLARFGKRREAALAVTTKHHLTANYAPSVPERVPLVIEALPRNNRECNKFSSRSFFSSPRVHNSTDISTPSNRTTDRCTWSTSDVTAWARDVCGLSEVDIDLLEKASVTGATLAKNHTLKWWERILPAGAALVVYNRLYEFSMASLLDGKQIRKQKLADEPIGEDMPFIGRENAIANAWPHIEKHIKHNDDKVPIMHPLLFAVGPPGIGKTRFGLHLPSMLKDYLMANKPDNEVLPHLSNVFYVPITFEGSNGLSKIDMQFKSLEDRVQWLLTARAIYNTFQFDEEYSEFEKQLYVRCGRSRPQDFSMQNLTRYIVNRFKPTMIYWHVDDVQRIIKTKGVFAPTFNEMTSLYREFNDGYDCRTLLLFTSTVYQSIANMLSEYNNGPTTDPHILLPMDALTKQQVYHLLDQMRSQHKITWLTSEWQTHSKACQLKKLVSFTSGIPRLIERLLVVFQENKVDDWTTANLDNLAEKLISNIKDRYQMTNEASLARAVRIAMAGWKFPENRSIEGSIENLRLNGYPFYGTEDKLTIPFAFLPMASNLSTFGNFWTDLITPSKIFSWEDWRRLTVLYRAARLTSLVELGVKTTSATGYFTTYLIGKEKAKWPPQPWPPRPWPPQPWKISERSIVELTDPWPGIGLPPTVKFVDELFSFIFINPKGSPIDSFEFVTEFGGGFALIVYHHSINQLSLANIKKEFEKIMTSLKDWKKAPTSRAVRKLIRKTRVVPVLITSQMIDKFEKEKLLFHYTLVDNTDHFGPLKSCTDSFSTTKPKTKNKHVKSN